MPIRTILSFLFAIILTPSLLAQSIEWEANYGGDTVDIGKAIVQTFNGGLAVAGYSSSSNGDVGGNEGYFDYWLLRTDSNGSIQWEQNYGGSAFDEAVSIVQTSDSGFAILGNSRSSNGDVGGNNGNLDYWVLKLDESGTIQWEKNYGGSDADVPGSIVQTSDSGFVVAGFSHSQDGDVGGTSGSSDYWVLKLDGSGTIQWDKTYGGTGDDEGRTVVQTSDGGFAVAGYSNSSDGDVGGNNGSGDHWLIKLDGSGNLEWEQNFGGSGSDGALSIVQSSDRGFTIAGNSESSDGDVGGNNGGFDQWVVKLDSTGTIQWEENLGGSAAEEARSIVQTPDGGYGIAGFSASSDSDVSGNNGVWDYWILKLNSSGSIQWEKNYGGSAFEDARSIIHTSDGGFAVAGESKSSDGDVGGNNGKRDFWVLKIDDTTSVSGLKKKKGQRDIAIEIQPNPTSGQLLIDLRKRSEEVRISIRDLTGRPIKRQRVVNAGSFRTSIEGEAGIYFVQLRTQDGRQEVYKVVKE